LWVFGFSWFGRVFSSKFSDICYFRV
jgi:hypothetical protein